TQAAVSSVRVPNWWPSLAFSVCSLALAQAPPGTLGCASAAGAFVAMDPAAAAAAPAPVTEKNLRRSMERLPDVLMSVFEARPVAVFAAFKPSALRKVFQQAVRVQFIFGMAGEENRINRVHPVAAGQVTGARAPAGQHFAGAS